MTSRRRLLWGMLLAFIVIWPVAVVLYAPLVVQRIQTPQVNASLADLQMLMNIRRYTISIPESKDGWTLGLTGMVDGEERGGGGASVTGGTDVVLLLEYSDGPRLNYCWYAGSGVMRGSLPNPLVNAGVATERTQGEVKPGDWLARGGRNEVSGSGSADFELLVSLSPPLE